MGPFDSRVIANRILDIAEQRNIRLTMMQLLKLVYIAHGWWLTYSGGQPLTSDKPQAWQYGPVHPLVYNAFRRFGATAITERARDPETGFAYSDEITSDIDSILGSVVDSYGKLHAYRLSDMTHQVGTPWDQASKKWGNYAPITDASIKEHFDELRRQRT
ncbi:type II toxin-antitoxin system antitoxin SocA domain-containing protein [Amylibacter sp. IMCC11727]|uniref:Panacea domain-containing protein n=1 Tax=Amylibacter sp. IMCC11727 TaxID=3039851 RepID=UPI00244E15FC|nr:type II toxin-antitoxin system antitoxin SocA domain-containing protein [Amylibacter sp. IMCC11727]WGI22422.1 DUF4065 domain-containing protein [Amylibacter sp. IMCC11727]